MEKLASDDVDVDLVEANFGEVVNTGADDDRKNATGASRLKADRDVIAGEEIYPGSLRDMWKDCREPCTWSTRHTVHLILIGTLMPTLFCTGANFGVAVGIFGGQDAPTMWDFPIPLAGNYFAITFVQMFANYVISGCLQVHDVLCGLVPPLHPSSAILAYWPKEDSTLYWYMQPTELILAPRDDPDKPFEFRLLDSIVRAGFWVVIAAIPGVPLSIGITYALYGADGYNSYPLPQWLGAIYGGILSIIFMPLWQLSAEITLGHRIIAEREAFERHADVSAEITSETGKLKSARSRLTITAFSFNPQTDI